MSGDDTSSKIENALVFLPVVCINGYTYGTRYPAIFLLRVSTMTSVAYVTSWKCYDLNAGRQKSRVSQKFVCNSNWGKFHYNISSMKNFIYIQIHSDIHTFILLRRQAVLWRTSKIYVFMHDGWTWTIPVAFCFLSRFFSEGGESECVLLNYRTKNSHRQFLFRENFFVCTIAVFNLVLVND